jgi:PAS domain S-box-containing protein
MIPSRTKQSFFRSRSGQGLVLFLNFCLIVAAGMGWAFYSSSLSWFQQTKSEEKITALRLVDAFVQNYSQVRASLGSQAPVPATFRAHAIDFFNKSDAGKGGEFRLLWVGREGRQITTPPADAEMAKTIESFAATKDPKPQSSFLEVGDALVFRTVYPSFAQQQSCVDCHNQLQPDQHWKLGELMGAFSIDVPARPYIQKSFLQATGLSAALFLVLGAAGLTAFRFHFRQGLEREAAQVSLADSEARFRDYAATASDWFWEQDETLRFIYTSPGAPSASAQDVRGKTRRDLVEQGDNFGISEAQMGAHEADLVARRPFTNLRFQRLSRDGEVRYMSVSGLPVFDADGGFRGYRGTGRDVTAEVVAEMELGRRVEERTSELREAQSELVRREKLSTLGQLTATVAHELRNPLSAIRNTVFAVRESVKGSGLSLDRPLLRVERNIQRCDRIITDLLDFTRMRELNCAEIEADPWLHELLDEQRLPDGVHVMRELGAPGRRVSFDAERMRRVVINLVENAAQALADAPEAAERTITVRTYADDASLYLAVEDTGPGISREVLAKVFEPLFSTKSFGTGLGLPTVKQIVEQHGGAVEIASVIGAGTKVVVRLPGVMAEEIAA